MHSPSVPRERHCRRPGYHSTSKLAKPKERDYLQMEDGRNGWFPIARDRVAVLNDTRSVLWSCCAILGLCLIVGLPTIRSDNYFLADDFGLVHHLHKVPVQRFLSYFVSDWTEGIYGFTLDELRPFPAISYWLDSRLFGAAHAQGYHVIACAEPWRLSAAAASYRRLIGNGLLGTNRSITRKRSPSDQTACFISAISTTVDPAPRSAHPPPLYF